VPTTIKSRIKAISRRTSFVSTTDPSGNTSTLWDALERRFADSERCRLMTTFSDHRQTNTAVADNPLESRGNYSATSNNTKLVCWPLTGGLLHLVQRGGNWAGPQPAQAPPHCTKYIKAHPSSASVPITTLLYNGPLLRSFNVGIKGLKQKAFK